MPRGKRTGPAGTRAEKILALRKDTPGFERATEQGRMRLTAMGKTL